MSSKGRIGWTDSTSGDPGYRRPHGGPGHLYLHRPTIPVCLGALHDE